MREKRSAGNRRRSLVIATGAAACIVAVAASGGVASAAPTDTRATQPTLSSRSVPIIKVDGLEFRDLNLDGSLTPYEDWRLSNADRATDLVSHLSLTQKSGLLVHGSLPSSGTSYNMDRLRPYIEDKHISTYVTRLSATPSAVATANNDVQELAESQEFAIPVVISTDPRNGFSVAEGQTVARVGTTAMPDAIGLGAVGDSALTRELGDIMRQEYRVVGITEALSPMADIATEPRWTRINGTFGSDPIEAKAHVGAYVAGFQNGTDGLNNGSVATVTKHWAGYGAQVNGYDSHYYYGRYASFEGGKFGDHLVPYEGAFESTTAGIMPTYSILRDLLYQGNTLEQVGAGFSTYMLQDLLRGNYGFEGVIVSDWGITGDCDAVCQAKYPGGPGGFGSTPWGMENATIVERFAKTIGAGVDQVGGTQESQYVGQAVADGLLSAARVDDAAHRVLVQKFELGLFENPFVDPAVADTIAGSSAFQKVGDEAQAKSMTLLKNDAKLLPIQGGVTNVFAPGISATDLAARGLTGVDDPAGADLAIVRLTDPKSGSDTHGLDFTGTEARYVEFQRAVDAGVPTIAVPKLDRPLILTNVSDRADAVLANYGVSDRVLLDTVFGDRAPEGRLPFEIPSSMDAVRAQLGDVPNDSKAPQYAYGFGLSYESDPPPGPGEVAKVAVSLSAGSVSPGGSITVTATGLAAGETAEIWLHSVPVKLASATGDTQGAFTASATIPSNTTLGQHTVVVRGSSGIEGSAVLTVAKLASPGNVAVTGSDTGALLALGGALIALGAVLAVRFRRSAALS